MLKPKIQAQLGHNVIDDNYKIIIIGAGITGLSTGLAWTKVFDSRKNPVLIIEKQAVPGGCVSTFAREGYRFDTVQIIPDVSNILKFFNIDIDLVKFENYYARIFLADTLKKTAKIIPIASDLQSFEDYLIRNYPEDKKQIALFFGYCTKMHSELSYLKTEPKLWEVPGILFNCWKIIANSSKTYKQFLEKFKFSNPEVYEILDIFSSFSGLSGDRCASLLTACAMITTLKGSFRPRNGFIQFPQFLRKIFVENGGKIMFNTTVEKILTEKGRAIGVELAGGEKIYSDLVVSTSDTQHTFSKMLGYEQLQKANPAYARKAREAVMSPSAIAIHIGLDDEIDLKKLGFDCGYNVLTTGRQSHEQKFDDWENGIQRTSDSCFHFGVISSSAITGGKPNLVIHIVPVIADNWIELRKTDYEKYLQEKQKFAGFFIKKVEEYMIHGLRDHIKFIDVSTPATYARYIGSPTGSNYDMMPVPGNFGKNRLKMRTPIKNLFHPKFSHGIWPSMQAGLQVVDMISGGKIMNGNAAYSNNYIND
jgi:phytoene dehydrogenase-like protein